MYNSYHYKYKMDYYYEVTLYNINFIPHKVQI